MPPRPRWRRAVGGDRPRTEGVLAYDSSRQDLARESKLGVTYAFLQFQAHKSICACTSFKFLGIGMKSRLELVDALHENCSCSLERVVLFAVTVQC